VFTYVPLCTRHAEETRAEVEAYWGQVRRFNPPPPPPVPEAAPPPAPSTGTIYYVKSGGHIKIGWASDLAARLRAYPPGSELLASHPGTRADERRLHTRFAVHRSHGREWYPLAPVVLAHIDRVVTEHGTPDKATFGAKPVEVAQPRPKQVTGMRHRNVSTARRIG
jgi:hypothetical protein